MNLTDHDILELTALCNALVDNALDDAQRARLAQMLAASEDARRFYVQFVGLSASLHDYAGETQAEAPDVERVIETPVWWQRGAFWWTAGSLAAAAAVTAASLLWFAGNDRVATFAASAKPELETAEADASVGQITSAIDCQWTGTALKVGDELRSGQRLELVKGTVEITFDSGAQVTLEGPVSLDLNSAWSATLRRGELRANVPKEAIGFRIASPFVEVVDLGTQFSMSAVPDKTTEVFVNKGKVEATARGTTSGETATMVLRENEARQFHRGSHAAVKDSPLKAKWQAKSERKFRGDGASPVRFAHWSFDGPAGLLARADGTLLSGDLDTRFVSSSGGMRTTGRWGEAMLFDGEIEGCATVPHLSANTPRTIAFWVRVPAETYLSEAGPMLAWNFIFSKKKADLQQLQIGWNTDPVAGSLGVLRTDWGRGTKMSATSLRDGCWHHITVLLLPPGSGRGKLQVKQYVDGRFEGGAMERSSKHRRIPVTGAADDTLWLGRSPSGGARFRGELDELFVVDGKLTPHQIRLLMAANTLQPTEAVARQSPEK